MFKENPNWSQCCSIQELHQALHWKFGITLILFEWNRANRWEFFEDISTVVMIRNTSQKHSRFLSKCSRYKYKVFIGQRSYGNSLRGSKIFICLLSCPGSTVHFTAIVLAIPCQTHLFLPIKIFNIINVFNL